MNNDEVKVKRLEIRKEIEQLSSKIGNPTAYTLADHQPYSDSPLFALDKEKFKQKLEEYRALPNVRVEEGQVTPKKCLSFSNDRYTLKYIPSKDEWQFYDGSIYMTNNVNFSEDGESAEAIHTTVNSDNYGEPVDHIYRMKCASVPDKIVERAEPIPCSKVAEGLATLKQDDDYWKRMGLVKDANTGRMRKMNTDEYDKFSKRSK